MILNRNRHATKMMTTTMATMAATSVEMFIPMPMPTTTAIKKIQRKKNDERRRNENCVSLCNEISIRFSSGDDDDMGGSNAARTTSI